MIHWLLEGQKLILRIAGSAVVSFIIVMLLAPRVIRFLIKRKLGDRPEFDHGDLNQLTRHKSNTPTMGGVLIVVAILLSTLLFADVTNMYIRTGLFVLLWLGTLGGVDDWYKLRGVTGEGSRVGLMMWEKMVFQVGMVVLISIFIWNASEVKAAHNLYLPFVREGIPLSQFAYIFIAALTIVGSSNAVNLTDGMDGLAAGCVAIAAAVFVIFAEAVGVEYWATEIFHLDVVNGSAEMTILCASIVGACLGFLWYNAHPAQVFMGDTGSLPLGGLLGFAALVTRQEAVLLIAGGVFVMEAVSVLVQVGYFKYSRARTGRGKRVFRVAPIHYHFHLGGWAESKVVVRFWLLGMIFAALALATLKTR